MMYPSNSRSDLGSFAYILVFIWAGIGLVGLISLIVLNFII